MRTNRVLLISIFLAILASCRDTSPVSPTDFPLEGTLWRLESFDLETDPIPAAQDQELTLTLLGGTDNGYIALATADCNDCGGEYSIWADDSISLWLACTEALCPDGTQGQLFQEALATTTVFENCMGVLKISFVEESFRGELVFRAVLHVDRDLP